MHVPSRPSSGCSLAAVSACAHTAAAALMPAARLRRNGRSLAPTPSFCRGARCRCCGRARIMTSQDLSTLFAAVHLATSMLHAGGDGSAKLGNSGPLPCRERPSLMSTMSATVCRLELLEAAGCSILACTIAWDADSGRARAGQYLAFVEAAAEASRALAAVREPGGKTAPAAKVRGLTSAGP